MSAKSKLKYSLKTILNGFKAGSYTTQRDRRGILLKFANDLVDLGYKLTHIQNLKQKHVIAVIKHWKANGLSDSTIKNRLSAIRHLAGLLNRNNIVPQNKELSVEPRSYKPRNNRALHSPDLSKIEDPYIRISIELQRVFGLRREESLKIKPHLADKKNEIHLQPSWCKGGRPRIIPIRNEEQKFWLTQAKYIVKYAGSSLIPKGKSYIQQRYNYDKHVQRAQLKNLHGLRHAYAQLRYKELTGWESPINGGPNSKMLTAEQKKKIMRQE